MSTTQDEPDLTDEVIEEYSAENGVRVDAVERENPLNDETTRLLKVYGTRRDRYSGLDGEETVRRRKVEIAQFPESNGFDILCGLAEVYGYELRPK